MSNNIIDDICLVTVTFNSEKVVANFSECANNFKKVFIVDNASVDSTEDLCKKYIPHAKFIKNDKNLGFSTANNIGFREALGTGLKYCIFVNPDCTIDVNSIRLLQRVFAIDERVAISNPRMMESGVILEDVLSWDYNKPYKNISPKIISIKNFKEGDFFENVCMNGACFMVDVEKFDKIEAFSDDIFLFMEEDDISLRVSGYGLKSVYVPSALAIHVGGGSTPKGVRIELRKLYNHKWSKLYLFNDHVGKFYRFLVALKLTVLAPLFFLVNILIFKKKNVKRWFAWWFAGLDGLFMTKFFRKFF